MRLLLLGSLCALMLAGCSLIPPEDLAPPPPLVKPGPSDQRREGGLDLEQAAERRSVAERFSRMPQVRGAGPGIQAAPAVTLFPTNEAEDITISVRDMTLPAFINEVFANQLQLDFQLAPELADKKDLVTLRVTEPRNRQGLFEVARDVLASYGVVVQPQGDYLRIGLGQSGENTEPPLIVTGQTLPSVPPSHRPVVLIRGLRVIAAADAYSLMRTVFEREQRLNIQRDNNRNALMLQGPPELVQHAAGVLNSLDQPHMRGRNAMRIDPVFVSAEGLAGRLTSTLSAQGYDIGGNDRTLALVPVADLNALFVFSPDEAGLALVRDWTAQLDQPVTGVGADQEGTFWYRVRNTAAADLAATLNGMLSGSGGGPQARSEDGEDRRLQNRPTTGAAGISAAASSSASNPASRVGGGQFVVSPAQNMLLFRGEQSEWQKILPLVRELDQAPDQVMVEVIVAEVTLNDNLRFGIEWALSEISIGGLSGPLGSVFGDGAPGSGLDAGGLSWTPISSSGQTRLALNAFASSDRVSILQTPRILVRSGETASVNVGSEVPIISRQSTTDTVNDGNTAILQDIQYRSTGVQLEVTPTVFSDGRIDLAISQDVSEAAPNQSSNINSPTILTRNLQTRLSLQDGSSVLIGGLISNSESQGNSRIPILGDLPVIGRLFRVDSVGATRTELMVLIVPYLIRDGGQAEAITRAFRNRLQLHSPIDAALVPLDSPGAPANL